jgi:HAD superfamily hydrolase (TIGR01484 family)
MTPLGEIDTDLLRHCRGVLTDIDDTLTTESRLTAAAYAALEDLQASGVRVIPVTGRPAGWCDHIARMWPVDAVVGENGAFYMRYEREARKLRLRMVASGDRNGLQAIGDRVIAAVPGAAWASDQPYRLADIAIDFAEDTGPLPPAEVDRIVQLLEGAGLQAKVSSIHVNAWRGDYDKLSTARLLLREAYDEDEESIRSRYLFIGDSPNDAPMFDYFPLSVGVANVRCFAGRMSSWPRYVTGRSSGEGFVELAEYLVEARKSA